MSYTYKSLTFVWLMTFGLLALTLSGAVAGPWRLLLILAALAAPALILRNPLRATPTSHERPRAVAGERDRPPLDRGWTDVYRWEDEGGGPVLVPRPEKA